MKLDELKARVQAESEMGITLTNRDVAHTVLKLIAVAEAAHKSARHSGPTNLGRYRIYDPGPIGEGKDTCRVSISYADWEALNKALESLESG